MIHRRDTEDAERNQRSDVRGQRSAKRIGFCLSGDDDKQKLISIADNKRSRILKRLLNRRFTPIFADEGAAKRRAHGASLVLSYEC